MTNVNFSEFRNHAREYMDRVEQGARIQIFRHGKPIALLIPAKDDTREYWRNRSAKPLELPGVSLSAAVLAEREEYYKK